MRYAYGMDLVSLRAFVTLARNKRFTGAARTLGVSQPSLSRQLQRLERAVSAKLVVRAPDGVVLTEAGERFLVHAERALASLESGVTQLAEMAGTPKGSVVLGTLPTVAAYVLPPLIARFHRRHPGVRLLLREAFSDALQAGVARGDLDLAITHHPVKREELSAQKLWREDYLLAVPPGHRLAGSTKPIALSSVATEAWVVVPGAPALAAIEAACAERGVHPLIALETDNSESVRRMVEAGLGISLVPRVMTRDRRRWRASLIEVTQGTVYRQLAIVHRGAGYLTAAARALRDAVVAHARTERLQR